jgi:hypothetical protein
MMGAINQASTFTHRPFTSLEPKQVGKLPCLAVKVEIKTQHSYASIEMPFKNGTV